MVESSVLPPLYTWLVNPLDGEVHNAIERLRRAPDVQHVAVMPDVHLAGDVCIGVAIGTKHLIYPQAVGGDIGCGVLAVPFEVSADRLAEPAIAGRVLAKLAAVLHRGAARRDGRHTSQIAMNIGTILAATISATLQWDLAITTGSEWHIQSAHLDGFPARRSIYAGVISADACSRRLRARLARASFMTYDRRRADTSTYWSSAIVATSTRRPNALQASDTRSTSEIIAA
jgi:hypothetical protein